MSEPISEHIQVFCRQRPDLCGPETTDSSKIGSTSCVELSGDGTCKYMSNGGNRESIFQFNGCFSPLSRQREVFERAARPIVESAIRGYNGTILAYGPTNSGKTFTMRGDDGEDSMGLIPRFEERQFKFNIF